MIKIAKLFLTIIVFGTIQPTNSAAQDISIVQSSAERDLLEAIDRLNVTRNEVSGEKIPLARSISQKENSILNLRVAAARVQAANDSNTLALADIRDDLNEWEQENNFLVSLLDEYARRFESDLNVSEFETYRSELDAFNALDPDRIGEGRLSVQLELIDHGFARIRRAFDGDVFSGKAVTKDGTVKQGQIARFGPLAYFHNGEEDINGLIASTAGGLGHLFIDDSGLSNLSELFEGQSVLLPIDVTNGKAISIQSDGDNIIEHISKGGVWIIPILLFAGISIAASVFKISEIYKIKSPEVGSVHQILTHLKRGDREAANDAANSVPYPVGIMLQQGLKHADNPKDMVEEIMYESMLDIQPKLEKYLPLIAISAATAPLLGLLGTVTGMINTFQLITLFGTGDAQSLSSGISEALITTEFGLIVAIPALIMHALLSRKVQSIMTDMEKYAVIFTNALPKKVA